MPLEEALEASNDAAAEKPAAPAAVAKCEHCNKVAKPGTADPANPDYVPKCSLGGADMRQVYSSDSKEEWVCNNLAKEAPITMDQYAKWKGLYLKTKFTYRK